MRDRSSFDEYSARATTCNSSGERARQGFLRRADLTEFVRTSVIPPVSFLLFVQVLQLLDERARPALLR